MSEAKFLWISIWRGGLYISLTTLVKQVIIASLIPATAQTWLQRLLMFIITVYLLLHIIILVKLEMIEVIIINIDFEVHYLLLPFWDKRSQRGLGW